MNKLLKKFAQDEVARTVGDAFYYCSCRSWLLSSDAKKHVLVTHSNGERDIASDMPLVCLNVHPSRASRSLTSLRIIRNRSNWFPRLSSFRMARRSTGRG